ncbi:UpxY family transcription antiterminator [Prevotella sp. HUN102]|uniref:UpxY family transcription antiterminator n=1 Tax=Prevotella sp. HUN102 TaxID=1392486 RepID=UPI00048D4867|nr:UpxY family transcription antiterminator [Prevotella sp. HUN102]
MEKTQDKYVDEIIDDGNSWYAIRLYAARQEEAARYFEEKDLESFIPMNYFDEKDKNGKVRRRLKPVVRNLIFVKKTVEDSAFRSIVYDSNLKMSVIMTSSETRDFYLIPHNQMYEFRLMCNPDITIKKFISPEEASMKAGDPVYVKFGPLKGMTGRLVRSSKKYYLLKEIPGISMMLKVTKWCCVPI